MNADNSQDSIVALDANGSPYPIGKLQAHVDNVRHLAVSVFVFCRGKLLVQRRAAGKYHSGGLWANTCCSHPRWQEPAGDCAHRRLQEELGVSVALRPFGRIDYAADVGRPPAAFELKVARLYENESVQCYVGQVEDEAMVLAPDPSEVSDTEWVSLDALTRRVTRHPARYTAWLQIYLRDHGALLSAVARSRASLTAAPPLGTKALSG